MRYNRLAVAVLLLVGRANAQEIDVEKLIGKPDPAIQAQIQQVYNALQSPVDPRSNVDAFREAQKLKTLTGDKEELVKQLAIFVVTTKSVEDVHVLVAGTVLYVLDFPPRVPIRVLAPCLDADDRQLRDFAGIWFDSHDTADTAPPGAPPIKPVNYEDYLEYVESKVTHKEEVPAGFVKYIFERSPGRALLVFAYANSHGDITTRLQAMRKGIEGQQKPAAGNDNTARQARLSQRREIELAEHIVSNAIWLQKNGFNDRFQAALPEATDELTKLAKHDQWWARLYVAEIMRQHRELRQPDVLQQLSTDSNSLVSEAAKSAH